MKLIKLSDVIWWCGILFTGIAIFDQIQIRNTLPPGVCPLDGHRQYFFIAIVLFILSFVVERFKKKKIMR